MMSQEVRPDGISPLTSLHFREWNPPVGIPLVSIIARSQPFDCCSSMHIALTLGKPLF